MKVSYIVTVEQVQEWDKPIKKQILKKETPTTITQKESRYDDQLRVQFEKEYEIIDTTEAQTAKVQIFQSKFDNVDFPALTALLFKGNIPT